MLYINPQFSCLQNTSSLPLNYNRISFSCSLSYSFRRAIKDSIDVSYSISLGSDLEPPNKSGHPRMAPNPAYL